jgi:hypothetical protein
MVRKTFTVVSKNPIFVVIYCLRWCQIQVETHGSQGLFFNLQKIHTNQYYESDSLNAGSCNMLREYMTLQDDIHIKITVHTWTAVFLKHLVTTSFMASFQA